MLRRFLILWLAISILGYGVALAADVHGEQQYQYGYTAATDDGGHAGHSGVDCGHCAHGAAHLTGLHFAFDLQAVEAGKPVRSDYRPALLSPPLQEFLKPPTLG